ncbi:hypothetical protein A6V36_18795 [Paraburkholderia ginsengiterrae]|uniref:Uncharacterized protein n=1 Tax=Paraburkholderia ginsengiterrae TaxID=1462993 RepID=A0A1A9MWG6_9BURK|nr:hypothetical protein [Paraburkholderia ginsengiterrae]OAJ52165.1 hypothetical protein A6V37_10975 [Paraburkholderia ginsengiterrae]OAJ63530.1 hypothetical protein A6V36_18795 [Paraburkholderia ginsengiterrae]
MSSLMIRDLSSTRELDRRAMSAVAGGTGGSVPGLPSLAGLGTLANINVSVNQNLIQTQNVNVAALNNIGVIGANFIPPNLNVSPALWGSNNAFV